MGKRHVRWRNDGLLAGQRRHRAGQSQAGRLDAVDLRGEPLGERVELLLDARQRRVVERHGAAQTAAGDVHRLLRTGRVKVKLVLPVEIGGHRRRCDAQDQRATPPDRTLTIP